MQRELVMFTEAAIVHSSFLDEIMLNHFNRFQLPNTDIIGVSRIWNDACRLEDEEYKKRKTGYRYEVLFHGTETVGLMSIWDESEEKFIFKHNNNSVLRGYKYLKEKIVEEHGT